MCKTVSVDRDTVALAAKETLEEDNRIQGDESDSEHEEEYVEDTRFEEENVAIALQEYAVDRIMRYVR